MGLYILLAVLAVLVIFICILLIRAALAAKKAEPIGEKPSRRISKTANG